jgi:hypothetical protein
MNLFKWGIREEKTKEVKKITNESMRYLGELL